MVSQNKTLAAIKSNKLFANVSESDFSIDFNSKYLLEISEGEIIFQPEENADHIYLIIDGKVKIKHRNYIDGQRIFIKQAEDYFGETEFLENTPRASSSVAETNCILYMLMRADFDKLAAREKVISNNIQGIEHYVEKNYAQESIAADSMFGEEVLSDSKDIFSEKDDENYNIDSFNFAVFKETESYTDSPQSSFESNFNADDETEVEKFEWDFGELDESADQVLQDQGDDSEAILLGEEAQDIEWTYQDSPSKQGMFDSDTMWNIPNGGSIDSDEESPASDDSYLNEDTRPIYESPTQESLENADSTNNLNDSNSAVNDSVYSKNSFSSDQLALIIQAAELVNSNVKLDEVLKSIVSAALSITDADRATLYIVDREANQLWSKILRGEGIEEIRLQVGQGLAGWVAQTGETVNIEDAHSDDRFDPDTDSHTGYTTNSMLCFPIKNRTAEVVGVLQLINSRKGTFTKIDENFLEALSVHAALALSNAELVQELLHADRLSSVGKVANFIISDIKKPILTIKHFAEHIKKKDIAQDVKQILDMIIDHANIVSDLVHTTLSYSQGKTIIQAKKQSLNSSLESIIESLADYVESRNVKLFKKFDKDVAVMLDKKEFYQACFQIAKNACDAMPGGGNLFVSTTIEDNIAAISFRDTGMGIPLSLIDRIFEPFMSQGKKNGVGLGLPIAEKIIKEHNGTITVESNLGEETIFTIKIPIAV